MKHKQSRKIRLRESVNVFKLLKKFTFLAYEPKSFPGYEIVQINTENFCFVSRESKRETASINYRAYKGV